MHPRSGTRETIGGLLLLAGLALGVQAETPRALWDDRVVGAPIVGPTLSGDTLWIAGAKRKIQSRDARTGKQHWKRTLPTHPVLPVVPAGEHLLVGLGVPKPAIILLDRRNGKEEWKIRLDTRPVAILWAGNVFLFATSGGSVGAYGLGEASVVWDRDLDTAIAGCAVQGESFYVLGRTDSLWCFDAGNGHRQWSVAVEGIHSIGPVVADSALMRVTYEGSLVEHDPRTGRLRETRSVVAPQVSPPAFSEGLIATVAVGGEIEVFDLESGGNRSLFESGETVAAGCQAWGAWWIVPTLKGRVLALTRSRGVIEWNLTFRDPISLPPAVGKDHLALIDDCGRMVVYELRGPS